MGALGISLQNDTPEQPRIGEEVGGCTRVLPYHAQIECGWFMGWTHEFCVAFLSCKRDVSIGDFQLL